MSLAELGAVPDVVLRRQPVGELGQHLGQFRMDRRAVVALHEVLDDELPVRLDVVADPATDAQVCDVVVVDRLDVAEAIADVLAHRVLERRWLIGQAHPHVAQPLPHRDAAQAVLDPVDVGHLGQVRRRHQLAVEVVSPGVVGALERALDFAALLGAQLGATMPADVEERAHLTAAGPGDQHALAADLDGLERAWLVEVGGPHGAEPHRLEDVRLLHREDGGVGVITAGQRRDEAVRQADVVIADLLCCGAGWIRSQAGTGTTASWRRQRVNSRGWSTPSTATG